MSRNPCQWIFPLSVSRSLAAFCLLFALFSARPLGAQFSFSPKPAPEARWFAITEFGAVLTLNRVEASAREQLFNWEIGLLGNLNSKNSLGGSLYISYSKHAEVYAGPKLRYRYWLNPALSVDAGAGAIWRLNYLESGAWLTAQFGLNYRDLAHLFLQFDFFEDTITSVGLKIGRLPGAILGVVAGGIAGVRYLISRLD